MELYRDVYKRLKDHGHRIDGEHVQIGRGHMIVLDGVAMPFRLAIAVADERLTVPQVSAALANAK